ncbi:MAG: DUF1501 domain-containing protein [Planctomycetaceae bacterium]
MTSQQAFQQAIARRRFLTATSQGFGYAALASLIGKETPAARDLSWMASSSAASPRIESPGGVVPSVGGLPSLPHFAPKAQRVIYLHMVGGPSQLDLYDYKPMMNEWYDKDLPESIRNGQRLTTMTSGQSRFPIAPSKYKFQQHGQSGMWVSELLPYTAKMVDDMCFIRSMHTEAINHEPAITFIQTGNQVTGRPCIGSWLSYGLGSMNENLPTFVVLVADPTNTEQVQAISARLWTAGYLPGQHAGVPFRAKGDPILFINNPPGVNDAIRRQTLDGINDLNRITYEKLGDPETQTRIEQYEMAFRMQASVPELTAIHEEPATTYEMYGEAAKTPGTFANSALMARRLVERGVRFVQIYHNNWDTHGNVNGRLPDQCRDVDQPCWGLIQDLKQRGMLDSTLVIWGGEFGRTIYSQGQLSKENYGRDHHPRCFTLWMAGGGIRPGTIYGETDDFSYNIVRDGVHVRDFHATNLHLLGIQHDKFTFKSQGLDQKLTGVEPAKVIEALLA